jgi:hypothetical protein
VSETHGIDTRFTLPMLDEPASSEVGVILMGLDADRLLAGLGLTSIGDDPALSTLLVDQIKHGLTVLGLPELVTAGARRWQRLRPGLAAATEGPATMLSLRREWARTLAAVTTLAYDGEEFGPASASYLTACWLRRDDVDPYVGRCLATLPARAPRPSEPDEDPDDLS